MITKYISTHQTCLTYYNTGTAIVMFKASLYIFVNSCIFYSAFLQLETLQKILSHVQQTVNTVKLEVERVNQKGKEEDEKHKIAQLEEQKRLLKEKEEREKTSQGTVENEQKGEHRVTMELLYKEHLRNTCVGRVSFKWRRLVIITK